MLEKPGAHTHLKQAVSEHLALRCRGPRSIVVPNPQIPRLPALDHQVRGQCSPIKKSLPMHGCGDQTGGALIGPPRDLEDTHVIYITCYTTHQRVRNI